MWCTNVLSCIEILKVLFVNVWISLEVHSHFGSYRCIWPCQSRMTILPVVWQKNIVKTKSFCMTNVWCVNILQENFIHKSRSVFVILTRREKFRIELSHVGISLRETINNKKHYDNSSFETANCIARSQSGNHA